jgi:RNA polymerase sigma-70 factor (ECF subfamily)
MSRSTVTPDDEARFERERRRLRSLAYRMTGTPDDADDVLQEVWIRWQGADRSSIENPAAWLTTVTTRVAIDRLTSARAQRELYVGPWIPEPMPDAAVDPAEIAMAADSLTLGFVRVLETLDPTERAVFLLHDVFAVPFAEIAATVGRNEPATRQLARRARAKVRGERPPLTAPPAQWRELSDAFLAAVLDGDVERLTTMLTDDVVHISDGGRDHHAARRPVRGADKVARLFVNLARREWRPTDEFRWVDVNGQPGAYVIRDGEPYLLTVLGWRDGRVAEALAIVNPDKLRHFHASQIGE